MAASAGPIGEGGRPQGRSVCLFAHFDPSGRIAPIVRLYLKELSACGFTVHVACSGVERLPGPDRDLLDRIGARAHLRPNPGHDFGAWQHLLRAGCAEGADEVLLANDSVLGPFQSLAPIFASMRRCAPDAWGMVASREGVWHLQSWFVCLTGAALARPAVRRVFAQPFETMSKAEIILHGELGLGAALQAEQLECVARHEEPRRRRLRRFARINPMHLDWATLLTSGTVPFIKRDLIRDNPIRIPWADQWPQIVAGVSRHCPDLVRASLAGTAGWRGTPVPPPPWRTLLLYLLLTRDKRQAARALPNAIKQLVLKPRRSPPVPG